MLGLIPAWAWRWIAVAGVGLALFGLGYVRGFLHEEHKFAAYQAQVDDLGKQAAARALERKTAQDKTTKEVRDGWTDDVVRIHTFYGNHPVVVRRPSSGGAMPAAPDCPARADGAAGESAAAGPDRVSEEACALDAAKVNRWREFARKNDFPVE